MSTYSGSRREKLANTIVFFAEKIPNLPKTKLLKLLYFVEEFYVRKHKVPFLDIDFEVWQAGPVNRDVYIELSDTPELLSGYIFTRQEGDATIIIPMKSFCDDDFSDAEIEILNFVLDNLGKLTGAELVELTHRPQSPWYQIAKEKGLLELFSSGDKRSSEEKIDFELFYCQDDWSKERYAGKKLFNKIAQNYQPA